MPGLAVQIEEEISRLSSTSTHTQAKQELGKQICNSWLARKDENISPLSLVDAAKTSSV